MKSQLWMMGAAFALVLSVAGCTNTQNVANHTANMVGQTANAVGNTAGSIGNAAGYGAGAVGNTVDQGANVLGNAVHHVTGPGAASRWMQVNTANRTLNLSVIAGFNGENNGSNFNGYGSGDMTITVPTNWTVKVSFENRSKHHQSVMVVPYAERTQNSGFTPALRGAASPHPTTGIPTGAKQTFSFVTNKPGHYAIISGVPSQSANGFWDTFVVSTTATRPTMTTK